MVIVFGAGGFIGTYLVDQLIADGIEVFATDVSELAAEYYNDLDVSYAYLDITQKDHFDNLPKENIEAVVHLACIQPASVSERDYSATDYVMVNVIGTLNILEFCREHCVPKVVYACSHRNTQGLWADKAGEPIAESDGRSIMYTGDYTMFSISESAATDCVEHYTQKYGVEGIVLRLPPVYGFGPHLEIFKDGKPIVTGFLALIEKAEQGDPIPLWGDPSVSRDIVYVKDVVAAIALALRRNGVTGLFNISSGKLLSLQQQAECVVRVFSAEGAPSEIRYEPEKSHYLDTFVYDITKARDVLGWQPKYSFEEMLCDFREERDGGRFAFLIKKRKAIMARAMTNKSHAVDTATGK
ncbi:nucleoside-diphosphate-sugar epimerase [Mycolicibacterium rhodesiae NBB3]|uniref:Nucleoside-diphosphate-sugar epimerase n=1 Tax=Mycolicibacterium rhodesiae (strain NBB3) TaxID=710685 RepID=G8RIV9_MYCRN|nr:NAD(P)-dependent oxidoreductase [Mycolicibacterium rhodesiae]AEV70947.1 nucleoside-diphosphate-sugar epimerase [Mycolicibacterium rhodesiae NBB3]